MVQIGKEVALQDDRPHLYDFLGMTEVRTSDAMITSVILVFYQMVTSLVDPRFTYSYMSIDFALHFDMICDMLDTLIHISTSVGKFVIVTYAYHFYSILFMGF